MASEIQVPFPITGKTIYAIVRNSIGQVWQTTTSTFVAYVSANLANYTISTTEQGTSSRYYAGNFPAVAAGIYSVIAYQQVGASAAETDPFAGEGDINWSGTAVIPLSNLPSLGTGTGQINPDGTGAVPIAFGTVLPTSPTANTVGEALFFADIIGGRVNVAQGGTSNTITLDSGASSTANAYIGDDIYLYGGTGGGPRGTGQRKTVIAYNTSTKVATVSSNWTTTPDSTTKFMTLPSPQANVGLWLSQQVPAPSQTGVPITDPHYMVGSAATLDANSVLNVSAKYLAGTALTGRDIGASVLISSGTGSGQLNVTSGVVAANATQFAGQTITCSGAVTIPAATLASTTNITSATGITVATNSDKAGYSLTQTFPTNFASLGISNAGKISEVVLVDTLTTYTGNTPQTGDAYAIVSSGTYGNSALHTQIGSPMQTYTQPAGFLAATFPGGTISNTTNIMGGIITTVTNLTNAPTAGDLTATMKASITAAVPTVAAIQSGLATPTNITAATGITVSTNNDKSGYSLAVSPPTAVTIAAAVWQDLLSSGDFGISGSIGALLKADINAPIGSIPTNPYTGTPPTSSAIASAVWQDAVSGDFIVSGSIGKSLFTSGNSPGTANGMAIVGSQMDLTSSPNATALSAIGNAILDLANGVETGLTLRQCFRLIGSVLFGLGGGGNPYRDFNNTKNRITYIANNGDRTSITRDAT